MADPKTSSSVAIVDSHMEKEGNGGWSMQQVEGRGGGELKCTAASGDCIERMNYHYLKSGLSDQQEMVWAILLLQWKGIFPDQSVLPLPLMAYISYCKKS